MFNKKNIFVNGAAFAASLAASASSVPLKVLNAFSPKTRKGKDGTDYNPGRTMSKRRKRSYQAHNTRKRHMPSQAPIPLKYLNRPVRERLAAQGFVYAMPVHGGYEGWVKP